MNRHYIITSIFVLVSILAVVSIVVFPKQRIVVDYRIVMCNRTPYNKSGVAVYFDGKFAAAAGNMVPGALASFGSVRLLPAENGEVRWHGEHGAKSVMVSIDGIPPNGLDDCLLFFVIEADDRVQFVYVPRDDQEKYDNIAVSLVPFRRDRKGGEYALLKTSRFCRWMTHVTDDR